MERVLVECLTCNICGRCIKSENIYALRGRIILSHLKKKQDSIFCVLCVVVVGENKKKGGGEFSHDGTIGNMPPSFTQLKEQV